VVPSHAAIRLLHRCLAEQTAVVLWRSAGRRRGERQGGGGELAAARSAAGAHGDTERVKATSRSNAGSRYAALAAWLHHARSSTAGPATPTRAVLLGTPGIRRLPTCSVLDCFPWACHRFACSSSHERTARRHLTAAAAAAEQATSGGGGGPVQTGAGTPKHVQVQARAMRGGLLPATPGGPRPSPSSGRCRQVPALRHRSST
jgi:hypothetical protein